MVNKTLMIGIGGVTCGGKTTLARALHDHFPQSKLISQDDYFLDADDPNHTWIPELNHINFDILSSLNMEKMTSDIQELFPIEDLIEFETAKSENLNDFNLIIIEGFCIFNYKPLRNLFHLKYYFTLSQEECARRRRTRVYEPPDCPGYFENCVWPEHINSLNEVQKEVQGVTYLDEQTAKNALKIVLHDIADMRSTM